MMPGHDRGPQAGTQGPENGQNRSSTNVRRLGPFCGCQSSTLHECGIGAPIPGTPRHVAAARDAWAHLAWLGLVDVEGFVTETLRPRRGAA